jgi:hypothetical protein
MNFLKTNKFKLERVANMTKAQDSGQLPDYSARLTDERSSNREKRIQIHYSANL